LHRRSSGARRLILASSSIHRSRLLERLGLPFETFAPQVDETESAGEPARELAARLADAKAASAEAPGAVAIGSDQVASRAGTLLRKPGTHDKALEQLLACQGRAVDFYTAATVIDHENGRRWRHVDHTVVHFATLDAAALDAYLSLERPYDCAGGFKAEGLGIVLFDRIDSQDPTALIGLPLIWVAHTLRVAGLDPLRRR
jgi:septum formation protein